MGLPAAAAAAVANVDPALETEVCSSPADDVRDIPEDEDVSVGGDTGSRMANVSEGDMFPGQVQFQVFLLMSIIMTRTDLTIVRIIWMIVAV